MKINTGRVRNKYNEALSKKQICNNMLIMAISAVCNELNYNNNIGDSKVESYIEYRNLFVKTAIKNGVSKDTISKYVQSLSKNRYPSDRQIKELANVLNSDNYTIVDRIISDGDLSLKKENEIKEMENRQRIKRSQLDKNEQKLFREVCDYISKNYIHTELTEFEQSKIKKLNFSNHIILQGLKKRDKIHYALQNKGFESEADKFNYIIGILKNILPLIKKEDDERQRRKKAADEQLESQLDELMKWYNRPNKGQYKPKKRKEYSWAKDMW